MPVFSIRQRESLFKNFDLHVYKANRNMGKNVDNLFYYIAPLLLLEEDCPANSLPCEFLLLCGDFRL